MSDFIVRYLDEDEYHVWDRFIDESEYGSVFHHSQWVKALFSVDPSVEMKIVACFKENTVVGGLIFGASKILGVFPVMTTPPLTCFSGLVFKERESNYVPKRESYQFLIIGELLDFIKQQYRYIEFSLIPEFKDIRIFNWKHFETRVRYTYQTCITEINSIEKNYVPDVKRRIKKGKDCKYSIRKELDVDHLSIIYDILNISYKRQNYSFDYSKEQFSEILRNPVLQGAFKVYTIFNEDQAVSSIVMVLDKKTAYYWLAGADSSLLNTGLNQLLLDHIMKELSEEGLEIFDFVGANTPSITKYKSAFGFDLVPYYNVYNTNGFIFRSLYLVKSLFKKRA